MRKEYERQNISVASVDGNNTSEVLSETGPPPLPNVLEKPLQSQKGFNGADVVDSLLRMADGALKEV